MKKKSNSLLIYTSLYLTLIFGFIFNENSTGGALIDYYNQKNISVLFSNNFLDTFLNFDNYETRHSPVFIIFLSIFERLNIDDFVIRLIHLHLCMSLPFIFFFCIKEKFKQNDFNNYFFFI